MTNPLQSDHQAQAESAGVDRRKLLRGAAAIAATAVTMKAASAATVTPFGETGVPTRSSSSLIRRARGCRAGRTAAPVRPPWF